MNPVISVIMPAYNAEHFVGAAVESILNQSYQNFELLIKDDGSSDKTFAIVKDFRDSRIKLFTTETNQGNVPACNFLFSRSTGEFIAIQDADDWSAPERLFRQLKYLESNPEVGLVGTGSIRIDEEGNYKSTVLHPGSDIEIRKHMYSGAEPCFVCASVMIRRNIYDQIGGYRFFFNRIGSADFDWIYRISEITQLGNLTEPLYYNRRHPASLTKSFCKDPLRRISPRLAYLFFQQRHQFGYDFLEESKGEELNKLLAQEVIQYSDDPSLIYMEYAQYLYSQGLFGSAARFALFGTVRNPWKSSNYLHLLHYIRKSIGD